MVVTDASRTLKSAIGVTLEEALVILIKLDLAESPAIFRTKHRIRFFSSNCFILKASASLSGECVNISIVYVIKAL